jgi:hypothetical protein
MKRTWVIIALSLALLAGGYLFRPGHVPDGQPALVELDPQALSALKAEFNRASNSLRLIVLLSPT